MLTTIIATMVLAAILFFAVRYIVRQKKSGVKCIGCPDGATCSKHVEAECSSHCCCK